MFNNLQALGLGIIGFAIIIGVGVVVLSRFAGSVDSCGSVAANNLVYNQTDGYCSNSTDSGVQVQGSAATSTRYLETQMGSTGLAGWTPAIIAISVGMLFLGVFLTRGGRKV